jgi:Xaa-Pro aminopeptidase
MVMRIISNKKIEQFRNRLQEKKIDLALFLTSEPIYDVNIEYFTGFQQIRVYSFCCMLMTQEKITLVVSPLSYDQAMEEAEADEIINVASYDLSLTKVLKEKLRGIKSVGILEDILPYKLYRKFRSLKFQDISDIILEIRSIKEPKEIGRIKKACEITNHGIKFIGENLSEDITDKELGLILEQELIRKGADELSFPTILTSGKRSALVHPYPSFLDEKLQKGLGLVDFGVRYRGYCSDVTIPFIRGKISVREEKIVQTVQEAYEKTIENLKVGVPTWKAHEIAETLIKKNGFVFKHSLGHGLGLELHDLPSISHKPKYEDELKDWRETRFKENMVFTIEPGVYEPGIGGFRLENDFLMTKKGPKLLTNSSPIIK